jgi:adenine/guanine/hypoxanthine permease
MSGNPAIGHRPKFWVPGDWNALFGFGTNILVNVLVLTGLLRFVLQMPDSLVFGRILPALGLMLCLSTGYYAFLAWNLARKTGRTDVCALPSGISVPHMFVVTFVVMLPIKLATNDPIQAWEAGLTWVFIQSFLLMAGGFIGPISAGLRPAPRYWVRWLESPSPSLPCGPPPRCSRPR